MICRVSQLFQFVDVGWVRPLQHLAFQRVSYMILCDATLYTHVQDMAIL